MIARVVPMMARVVPMMVRVVLMMVRTVLIVVRVVPIAKAGNITKVVPIAKVKVVPIAKVVMAVERSVDSFVDQLLLFILFN